MVTEVQTHMQTFFVVVGGISIFFLILLVVGMFSPQRSTESNGFVWNRRITNFRWEHDVEMAVRGCDKCSGKLAKALFRDYIKGKEFPLALQGYLDLCHTIQDIRYGLFGGVFKSSAGFQSDIEAHGLMYRIATVFAEEMPLSDDQIAIIKKLIKRGFFSVDPDDWYIDKLKKLIEAAEFAKL